MRSPSAAPQLTQKTSPWPHPRPAAAPISIPTCGACSTSTCTATSTAAAVPAASPDFARAQKVPPGDARLRTEPVLIGAPGCTPCRYALSPVWVFRHAEGCGSHAGRRTARARGSHLGGTGSVRPSRAGITRTAGWQSRAKARGTQIIGDGSGAVALGHREGTEPAPAFNGDPPTNFDRPDRQLHLAISAADKPPPASASAPATLRLDAAAAAPARGSRHGPSLRRRFRAPARGAVRARTRS